jgi:uncharacterized protein with HEPN domain
MSHRDPEKYLYDMLSSCDFLLDSLNPITVWNVVETKLVELAKQVQLLLKT